MAQNRAMNRSTIATASSKKPVTYKITLFFWTRSFLQVGHFITDV